MDLLIEKGDKRTYLSRYKVITTSFEESAPSVNRNNTQIQYRNGNVDFGGWNEAKTIDYVGYYRADDLEDEEYLRERIYALLSDPEGYYITQLKNDNDDSFERPGETSGDYFDKQVNRPSHKRFYVYASSLESELVGSYGGHVLYKISATFTTMKLPYGESMPRDLEIKPNVPYYGRNYFSVSGFAANKYANADIDYYDLQLLPNTKYTVSTNNVGQPSQGYADIFVGNKGFTPSTPVNGVIVNNPRTVTTDNTGVLTIAARNYSLADGEDKIQVELGDVATPWTPAAEDHGYNEWYLDTYYNTENLVVPYAGTVPCSQLEQGFTIEFTAKEAGSRLVIDLNGTELTYSGSIVSDDVFKLSGYEYTKNDISIVKATNKAYFKLIPGIANTISSNLHGSIKILGYQDLYA